LTDAQFAPPPPKSTGALANFRIPPRSLATGAAAATGRGYPSS